jgi:hypothetical protein
VASSQPLFFPPAAFVVFDGDSFILQVHSVFTRIHSRALVVALCGGRTQIYASLNGGGVHWWRFLAKIYWEWLQLCRVKNPKGFGFYL